MRSKAYWGKSQRIIVNKKLLTRAKRLRDPKNTRKRADQKALALAWAHGVVLPSELSRVIYGHRSASTIYVHLAQGLRAHIQDVEGLHE